MEGTTGDHERTSHNPLGQGPIVVSHRVLRWTRAAVFCLSVLFVLLFLISARARVLWPYDINDTGMLLSVQRVAAGLSLYPPPNVHFTPYLYTPVYFYASAAMAHLTGLTYAALRGVSVLSTLGCFFVLYALVYREAREHLAAVIAVGAFASCYPMALQWFDVGRVDMLYLFLVLLALYATRWWNPILASLFWVLAFQTKQGVLPIAVLAFCHDWQRPRRVLLGLVSFAVLLLSSIAALASSTHQWYRYYVFDLIGGFGYDRHVATRYLTVDLLGPYGIALMVILAAMLLRPIHLRSRASAFWLSAFVSLVGYTGYVRAHRGAGENALLPAFLWICMALGLAVARVLPLLEEKDSAPYARVAQFVLLLAVGVQLASHAYSPFEFRPQNGALQQRQSFEAMLASIHGDVMVAGHPEYAVMAGKTEYAQSDAVGSIIDAPNRPLAIEMRRNFADLVHQRRLAGFAFDWPAEDLQNAVRDSWMPRDFLAYYPLILHINVRQNPNYGLQPILLYMPCTSLGDAQRIAPGVDASACQPGSNPPER